MFVYTLIGIKNKTWETEGTIKSAFVIFFSQGNFLKRGLENVSKKILESLIRKLTFFMGKLEDTLMIALIVQILLLCFLGGT